MRNVSEVYRNVNDATAQAASVLLGVVGLVSDGLILIAITSVLLVVSPIVTISTIAFFALLMLGTQWLLRAKQESLGEEIAEQRLLGWQFLMPAFDGFRESRLSSSGGKFVDGYREARRKGANAQRALSVYSELPKYLLEIGFIVAIVGIASTLLGTSGEENALTVLAVFTAASLRALPTLNRIAATFAIIRGNQAGLRIISEATADLAEDVEHQEVPLTDSRYAGDIVLRDVSYRFLDGSVDSIRQIDLKIEENQSTAIVGASGAGKSTLLDIILGLLTPTKGTVKVGGRDIKDDLSSWYSVLGVVPQDVFILNATIRENIAFGEDRDAIDEARVREVLEMAELSTLVAAMPEGLNTIVGERGARLSGGQRQRIGLARALYRRPRILVLDEATSALDNETEYEISQTLESLKGDLTVIIVAHRLSTVKNVDHLVYLDSGMIVGQGSVAEVQKSVPQFAKLLELGELK